MIKKVMRLFSIGGGGGGVGEVVSFLQMQVAEIFEELAYHRLWSQIVL